VTLIRKSPSPGAGEWAEALRISLVNRMVLEAAVKLASVLGVTAEPIRRLW
jgi:hypothetical protein